MPKTVPRNFISVFKGKKKKTTKCFMLLMVFLMLFFIYFWEVYGMFVKWIHQNMVRFKWSLLAGKDTFFYQDFWVCSFNIISAFHDFCSLHKVICEKVTEIKKNCYTNRMCLFCSKWHIYVRSWNWPGFLFGRLRRNSLLRLMNMPSIQLPY